MNFMDYQPNYSKDKILVKFKEGLDLSFAEKFAEKLGYKLIEKYPHLDCYVLEVKSDEVTKTISNFEQNYLEFIEWVNKFDLKLDSRWRGLEKILKKVEQLNDNVDIPGENYNLFLDKIIDELKKLKED